jgi:hypothetical protein
LEERPFSASLMVQRAQAFEGFASAAELKRRGVDPCDRTTILDCMLQPLERLPLFLRRNPHGRGFIF